MLREHLIGWINGRFNSWEAFFARGEPRMSATAEDTRALISLALDNLCMPPTPDWTNLNHTAALRARLLWTVIADEDRHYGGVRRVAGELLGVNWREVPLSIADLSTRDMIAELWDRAGALDAEHSLMQDGLQRNRSAAEMSGTPQSRRDVSLSLGRIGDIDVARGDLDAAVSKFQECLDITRTLASELGTPQSQGDLLRSLRNMAGVEFRRGAFEASLEHSRAALVAIDRAYVCTPETSRSELSHQRAFLTATQEIWQSIADCLEALHRYEAEARARAHANDVAARIPPSGS